MRWSAAFFVLLHMLLRGAAVPHSHEADGHDRGHASRAHVHLTWHGSSHDHHHGHSHHDADVPPHESEPLHADDVVYLDHAIELVPPKSDVVASDISMRYLSDPSPGVLPLVSVSLRSSGAPRPPGDPASALRTLLPHVLRI